MRFPIPAGTGLPERLRLFESYLEEKYQQADAVFKEKSDDMERRAILKAERAEVAIIQGKFRQLFEQELSEP